MTSYAAYDAGLPCKNPSCKSKGKPHPNCRCYGNMAEGGEVEHFCAKDRKHEPSCEYFADGGTVESPLHVDPMQSASAYLASAGLHNLIKMNSDDEDDALERYNLHVKRGQGMIEKRIDHLFDGKMSLKDDLDRPKKIINDWIEKGGVAKELEDQLYADKEPQNMAEGGEAKKEKPMLHEHPINVAYPDQNMYLQTAKGRMSEYLNSLKPQKPMPKMVFDYAVNDKEQKKKYDKALQIAAHPLSILEKIHKGTILPDDIKHLKALHPEVDDMLQKGLTKKVMQAQLEGKRPSYKVRQGLSLYLGAPLASEMTAPNMQAIQASFKVGGPQQPQMAPKQEKGNTSSLSKTDDSFMTDLQSRIAKDQHQKN